MPSEIFGTTLLLFLIEAFFYCSLLVLFHMPRGSRAIQIVGGDLFGNGGGQILKEGYECALEDHRERWGNYHGYLMVRFFLF